VQWLRASAGVAAEPRSSGECCGQRRLAATSLCHVLGTGTFLIVVVAEVALLCFTATSVSF